MSDLVKALYLYAQENLMGRCLQSWEYRQKARGAGEEREALRATLTKEQDQKLETFLSREGEINFGRRGITPGRDFHRYGVREALTSPEGMA